MQKDIRIIESFLSEKESDINKKKGMELLLTSKVSEIKKNIEEINKNLVLYTKCIEVLDLIQKNISGKVKENFENIVTFALKSIVGDKYSFHLNYDRWGGLQEVDFDIKEKGFEHGFNPLDTTGGGIIDIVSIVLRIAVIELYKPKINGFIVLDEPFKHLSTQYRQLAAEFIVKLSQKIKRQIILITHINEFIHDSNNLIKVG